MTSTRNGYSDDQHQSALHNTHQLSTAPGAWPHKSVYYLLRSHGTPFQPPFTLRNHLIKDSRGQAYWHVLLCKETDTEGGNVVSLA
jgi:hypothetical protein